VVELIKEALAKSPEFTEKMQYWVHKRKKQPDPDWILKQLAIVLGEDRVIEFLK
jgi:hypothetical protein